MAGGEIADRIVHLPIAGAAGHDDTHGEAVEDRARDILFQGGVSFHGDMLTQNGRPQPALDLFLIGDHFLRAGRDRR